MGTRPIHNDGKEHLKRIVTRPGPFTSSAAALGLETLETLERLKVLVIGAGGLGCELLKNLALSGFKDIHVIDMDIIDVSNLNRQFLFRHADVGKPKCDVAAKFVERRVPGVKITPYYGKIQDKDENYYMQFNVIICGLDSIEARRWINATVVGMVDENNPDSYKPLIDGGTEGFKGQAKVVLPTMTSCLECQLDMHAPRVQVPLCTLATVPRQPEHCIEWAHIIAWEEERKGDMLDTDDPDHISWLYRRALNRAQEFNISGVTYSLTQGVVKNIIPAIASTNAIVAASCCNEALKIATACNPCLGNLEDEEANTYMMYTGDDGIYTFTFRHEKKDDCPVCGTLAKELNVNETNTLAEFLEDLAARPETQIKKPTIRTNDKSLYYPSPPSLEEQTRPNLLKRLTDLVEDGEEMAVTDSDGSITFKFKLVFSSK
ncbi:hypothetical protein P152DRAFT_155721 [Eremomyces bilateralis CBS 781.70]|uniref:NEDD8-activating enzyme E1 catalytic subunit n=1 Tax=Eremomyces bilateralis CBS 781.70 TaxID=1392243 RepID=A0A6G1FVI6_9PEZI|nr:uncharacterized protein P152DRAFT_155721 [Eremomyces bilateralis CBS 781.70]KAF1809659.1 hypothetical protein P152DRAFT_155721 [Eremomyces bilateralis CBS 781.70]